MLVNNDYNYNTIMNNYNTVSRDMLTALEKIVTGTDINDAADDSSGLIISDNLRTEESTAYQYSLNANNGIALLQIAEGAMKTQSNILDVIKMKAIQMADSNTTEDDRIALKTDILELVKTFDKVIDQTNYNGIKMLSAQSNLTFFYNNDSTDFVSLELDPFTSCDIGSDVENNKSLSGINTGFSEPTPLSDILSSDLPGLVDFDWDNVAPNENDEYIFTDFDPDTAGDQVYDLGGATETLLNVKGGYVEKITLEFNNFGFYDTFPFPTDTTETLSVVSGGSEIGRLEGRGYSTVPAETIILDPNKVESWDYSELANSGDGPIDMFNIKGDISISVSGAVLKLNSMVITMANPDDKRCAPQPRLDANLQQQGETLIDVINSAREQFDLEQSKVFSTTEELEILSKYHYNNFLAQQNAKDTIKDIDFAVESYNFTKQSIAAESGMFAMSQANALQENVYKLLSMGDSFQSQVDNDPEAQCTPPEYLDFDLSCKSPGD
ncbi:MAG: flagellin [Campylobacterota bacterium]|nr:flagellin [Campylobacterota bacterium]